MNDHDIYCSVGGQAMETVKPPTGQDIWRALREELATNLYPLPATTLAPSVYHVYLHPEDFETIEGIVPRIVAEISSALTKDVERLNQASARRGGPLRSLLGQHETVPPIEVPAGGWEIYIQADQDEELTRGTLGIVSKLMMPSTPEYGGTPTVRTVKTVVTDHRRSTSSAATGPGTNTARTASTPRATLSYDDDDGHHVFIMRKDSIKIGRGGSDAWVDVQVITNPKVSREHCWIRYDGNGRFFIRDTSTWGTFVNGQVVPAPVRSADGVVTEPGAEHELAGDARIELSDALLLQFHPEPAS